MCGITGFYSKNKVFSYSELMGMAKTIVHRGPDAEGYFYDESIGLAHLRLSIIDLSSAANQPMTSHNNRYIAIFNGEIYNYKEIAAELAIPFRTNSDTEIVIEAFSKWGVEFVNRLNGMFAIVIYDKQNEELYLFRDRIGIKPIYYFWDGLNFAFASELKALLIPEFIKKQKRINQAAIGLYLHLGYIPQPHSIYKNIYKFPAGSFAKISSNDFTITSYWRVEEKINHLLLENELEAKDRLRFLLEKSVKQQLISDVPFGTFLSGGIDSSLVTAIAQKVSNLPINTFSIGFKEAKYNESNYALEVAKYLKTNHHELIVSENDAKDLVGEIVSTYDEPYADSSAIPTMLVSKLARKQVTMVLSGDGGDELFWGYGAYNWAQRLSNPTIKKSRHLIATVLNLLNNRARRAAQVFDYKDYNSIKSHIFSQEQYMFSSSEVASLLVSKSSQLLLNEQFEGFARKLNSIEQQSLFDLNYYLKDDLLVKVDRASMKYALEVRVPLLDHEIVEFAVNLSPQLKINAGTQKYLLKQVLYDYVPKQYFNRPKQGFAIPLKNWLKTDLKYLIDEYLSKQVIEQYNVVQYNEVKRLKNDFLEGKDYLYNRLWQLIVLHNWFENNNNTL